MKNRWPFVTPAEPQLVSTLQQALNIQPKLCSLLVQRGVSSFNEAKEFFRPNLSTLHNPFLMRDMDKAVERINASIQNNQQILIYGDYDVDGTTAVSLVYSFLINHYQNISTYIPDRYKEGYGISTIGIDYAADNDFSLIIALDCGIKAIDKVAYATEKGIDFIICDHHRPGAEIPKAVAVLDPKRKDCAYPFDELSGCGVGFKLVQALCKDWNLADETWHPLLDLLAVSIGADIVPIVGENRVLAFYGLKLINENPRTGFKYLKKLAQREEKIMDINDVVFTLGPRINAAGRVAHGELAVKLLTSSDEAEISELSTQINLHNENRKTLDKEITVEAMDQIEQLGDRCSTVAYSSEWHKGVIGIVASRLVETFYRPTVVFTKSGDGILAGSARSVMGFDVYHALEACADELIQFGGHMYAAGMTMEEKKLPAFMAQFEKVVQETMPEALKTPEISVDATLLLSDFLGMENQSFNRILKQFAPFGPQNLSPIFRSDNLMDTGFSKAVGEEEAHLRIVVKDPESNLEISGIGFGMGDKIQLLKSGKPVSVLYHLEENNFKGNISLQLKIKDLDLTENRI